MPPSRHNVPHSPAAAAAAGAAPAAAKKAADDLRCTGCGYNLRGLPTDGRCPECGVPFSHSLAAEQLRLARTGPPDAPWARQIREGAWLGLGAFALMLAAVLAPDRWYDLPYRNAPVRDTPGRIVFLAAACAWWVLAWASAWKLTTRERFPGHRPPRALVATAARWLATLYGSTPFVWAAATWGYDTWSRMMPHALPVAILELVGVVGGVGLFVRVAQLMRRRRAWIATVEAWLLAIAVPGGVLFAAGVADAGPSSLTTMFDLPVYPYGMPAVYENVIVPSLPQGLREWEVCTYAVLPLWTALLLLRLALQYRSSAVAPPGEAVMPAPSQLER